VNYVLNYRFTFMSQRPHRAALPRFLIVAAAGVLLNAAVLAALLATVRLNYLIMQVLATGVLLIAGFAANRRWTF
jgi:putative flippase GtrA